MKSNAPFLVASTAVLIVPWPEMTTTGSISFIARSRSSTSSPSMPGIFTSSRTRSGVSRSTSASPSWPVAAPTNSYPSYSSVIRSESRIAASSSTTNMRDLGIRQALSFFDPDGLELSLVDVGRVDVKGQDVARPGAAGDAPELADRFDAPPVDLEQDAPALHVGIKGRAHRLDTSDEHAFHRARQIETIGGRAVDFANREAEQSLGIRLP